MIKAILLDVGGTLYSNEEFDKQYSKQLYRLLARDKNTTPEEAKQLFKETQKKAEEKSDRHVTKVAVMAELGYTRSQVHEAFCRNRPSDYLKPDPALNDMLNELSKRYMLGIVSNFRTGHTREILKALGVSEKHFKVIVGEDTVKEIKPAGEPFLKAAETLGIEPGEALYVSDSVSKDLKPAKKTGMRTVLVNPEPEESEHVDRRTESILKLADVVESF